LSSKEIEYSPIQKTVCGKTATVRGVVAGRDLPQHTGNGRQ